MQIITLVALISLFSIKSVMAMNDMGQKVEFSQVVQITGGNAKVDVSINGFGADLESANVLKKMVENFLKKFDGGSWPGERADMTYSLPGVVVNIYSGFETTIYVKVAYVGNNLDGFAKFYDGFELFINNIITETDISNLKFFADLAKTTWSQKKDSEVFTSGPFLDVLANDHKKASYEISSKADKLFYQFSRVTKNLGGIEVRNEILSKAFKNVQSDSLEYEIKLYKTGENTFDLAIMFLSRCERNKIYELKIGKRD